MPCRSCEERRKKLKEARQRFFEQFRKPKPQPAPVKKDAE